MTSQKDFTTTYFDIEIVDGYALVGKLHCQYCKEVHEFPLLKGTYHEMSRSKKRAMKELFRASIVYRSRKGRCHFWPYIDSLDSRFYTDSWHSGRARIYVTSRVVAYNKKVSVREIQKRCREGYYDNAKKYKGRWLI